MKFFRQSLRNKFLAMFIGVSLCLAFILYGVYAAFYYKAYEREAMAHMEDIAHLSAGTISSIVEDSQFLSTQIIADPLIQRNLLNINEKGNLPQADMTARASSVAERLRNLSANFGNSVSIRLYTLNGKELGDGKVFYSKVNLPVSGEDIMEKKGSPMWVLSKENYLCILRGIYSTKDLRPLGYMVIPCRKEVFSQRIKTVPKPFSSVMYMIDSEGTIMVAQDTSKIGEFFGYKREELKEIRKNTIKINGEEGIQKSFFYLSEPLDNGWSLVALVTTEDLNAGLIKGFRVTLLVMLILVVLAIVVVGKLTYSLTRPMERLSETMKSFGNGNLDLRVLVTSEDEMGNMSGEYNRMADNIQNLLNQVVALEVANKEAQIEFLKMQINPHFLYNTLDTISWMGFSRGQEDISDLAVSLAALLRAGIKSDDIVTVRDELKIVDDYMKIQKYRFSGINIIYDVKESVYDYYMPNFILQPLVENSLVHGLEEKKNVGNIYVSIKEKDKKLHFSVEDDGKGFTKEELDKLLINMEDLSSKNSIGLKNVYRRLLLIYGEESKLKVFSEAGKGAKVSFCINIQKGKGKDENKTELSVE